MNLSLVIFGLIGFHFLGVREFPSIDPPDAGSSKLFSPPLAALSKECNGKKMGLGPSNIGKTDGDFASLFVDSVQGIGRSLRNGMHSVFTVKKWSAIHFFINLNTRHQPPATHYRPSLIF
jgi:hypothetical protein